MQAIPTQSAWKEGTGRDGGDNGARQLFPFSLTEQCDGSMRCPIIVFATMPTDAQTYHKPFPLLFYLWFNPREYLTLKIRMFHQINESCQKYAWEKNKFYENNKTFTRQ